MVAINEGEVLYWDDIKKNLDFIRAKQVRQLIRIYNEHKDIANDPFKWGDEIELSLIKFDHENKKCFLLLKSEEFFKYIEELKTSGDVESIDELNQCEFHNEYTSYIIETIPGAVNEGDVEGLIKMQDNIKLRRRVIQKFLGKDEHVIALTSFPLLGCQNFTYPPHNPVDIEKRYSSLFYSNDIIMKEALFVSATNCKIDRADSMPVINVPVYRDTKTPAPYVETLPNGKESSPDQIFMDHDGFAMGCCCIQVTFQGESLEQACHLYDQLTPIGPLVIAMSASSPIWRGTLSDIDCRWNVLKQAFDDRTKEERGEEPLKNDRYVLRKSRFDATDVFLSKEGAKYNDFEFDKDQQVYDQLVNEASMESHLANHFANMFTRDPMLLYKDDAFSEDESKTNTAAFDFFNCSNWRILRFKPPPINESGRQIGWRVEFRPTELQFTDFENTAFSTFIILLTRAITKFNLNFLIGTSKVSENMDRAQKRNACLAEKFFFRQNVEDFEEAQMEEMSMNEIVNGSAAFKGLLHYINQYLNGLEMSDETRFKIDSYLKLFQLRASGVLKTPATWIRNFVTSHEKYKQDSKIHEEINYDLLWKIHQMSVQNVMFDSEGKLIFLEKL